MEFGPVAPEEAIGAILAHGAKAGALTLRKGRVLTEEDAAALRQAGVARVIVARLGPDDVPEDEAAHALAKALAGPGVEIASPFTGRCNLFARAPGLARVDAVKIDAINAIDEAITIATLADLAPVESRTMLATIKIIPFAAPRAALEKCLALAAGAVGLAPYAPKRAALIQTRLPGTKDSVLAGTEAATRARLAALGSTLDRARICAHDETALVEAIRASADCDPILVIGASAVVDRRDAIPTAIVAAGGSVDHFGMPVDPGNLLLIGRVGSRAVIGLPGCARSTKLNGFDWVLRRHAAGLQVGRAEIARMGVGGLLAEIPRPSPRAGRSGESGAPKAPKIAAIVLAAGRSSRMAPANKLFVEIDGKTMLARAVEAATGSQAVETIVVVGNDAARAKAALSGVRVVENPDYASGLAGSVRAGIAAVSAECDGAVVLLGDMPMVASSHVDRLIAAFAPVEGSAICVAAHGGKRGNPVLWSREFFPAILALDGDRGARGVMREHEDRLCEVPMPDDGVLIDLDTAEALAAFRAAREKRA
jgi:molybdenum cofactor cytidylyltransferase